MKIFNRKNVIEQLRVFRGNKVVVRFASKDSSGVEYVWTMGTNFESDNPMYHYKIDLSDGGRCGASSTSSGMLHPEYPEFAVLQEGGGYLPTITLWTWGDSQLGELLLSYVTGECPWGIVCDKFRDLGLME